MATKQKTNTNSFSPGSSKVLRPGVHAKTRTSTTKHNKNYTKSYKGQGK